MIYKPHRGKGNQTDIGPKPRKSIKSMETTTRVYSAKQERKEGGKRRRAARRRPETERRLEGGGGRNTRRRKGGQIRLSSQEMAREGGKGGLTARLGSL